MVYKRKEIEVNISSNKVDLFGDISLSEHPKGIVIFAHGSGSSRKSPRNRYVAKALNQKGYSTLLFDLLTVQEERNPLNIFDIELLGNRLMMATQWLKKRSMFKDLPIAYFGASTGAAAALFAASKDRSIYTVVSRGGRPDLAYGVLHDVRCPTLLVVGEKDPGVLKLNQKALLHLENSKLEVIPGATHLFEERGALDKVIYLANKWFDSQMYQSESSAKAVSI